MDEQSLQYVDFVKRQLNAVSATNKSFVFAELKRLGFKPKAVSDGVYCDIGRAKSRTAFYAELGDIYQTATLLCFAAELAITDIGGVRLIFDEANGEHDWSDGISELYCAAIGGEAPTGGIGCCYGVACAGLLEFSLKVIGGEWPDESAEVGQIAERYAMACELSADKQSFALRYFDKAKCESALLDVERSAQKHDDENGTEHVLTVTKNYPPLRNDALCVDKVRHASDSVTLIPTSMRSYGVSRYLDNICGCMVTVSDDASLSAVVRLFLRLADTRRING